MNSDPIIEAAIRAEKLASERLAEIPIRTGKLDGLVPISPYEFNVIVSTAIAKYAAAVTPLIEANALERAAKVMEAEESYLMPDEAARAIRFLKEQP